MLCPYCGFDNPNQMVFCGQCGKGIARLCSNCQAAMPLDFHFCGQCGSPLVIDETFPTRISTSRELDTQSLESTQGLFPEETLPSSTQLIGERRHATVLVADVVESTVILEKIGSEAWVEVMNQVLQTMGESIYRFGGEVDQFRGDGMVAFFGAHSAHEDDPERATLSALIIQENIKSFSEKIKSFYNIDIKVRIGVNTGEIITTNIGKRDIHSEDTAMGSAITLAARLEASAAPGTILVGEDTYRLTANLFKWNSLGEIAIRGISQPVSVYTPLNPLFEAEQQHRLQTYGLSIPLIGRDDELETLNNRLNDLRNHKGGILLLSGDAGMGKSRLIFEARQQVIREEALQEKECCLTWLQGRCRSYGQSLLDSMWVDMLQRWLGMGRWIPNEEALSILKTKSEYYWGDQYEDNLTCIATFLSLPLEKHLAGRIIQLDAEGLRNRFFLSIYQLLAKMAQEEPVVIVFSEAHWADQTSLELLKFCLPLCEKESVFFVIVYRPERTSPIWAFQHFTETNYHHRLTILDLTPLDDNKSRDLLYKMIGDETITKKTRDQIIIKADGNPYYLTELVHSLVDKQILVRDNNTGNWQAIRRDIELTLPGSLKSLLHARIDSLSPAERRVLQMASVIGPIFWFEILCDVTTNGVDLQNALSAMQRARLITERGSLPDLGREYAFTSTLIREAAYDSILSTEQSDLHLHVAKFMERVVKEDVLHNYHGLIAYHYSKAGICNKELFHTLLSADGARKIYANFEAIQAYKNALDLLDQSEGVDCIPPNKSIVEWRLEALCGLGATQFGIGEIEEAEKSLRAAVNLGREINLNPPELTRLFYWLGEVLFWQNQHAEPIHLGEEGLFLLGDNNQSTEAALMNQLIAVGCSQLGDHAKFIKFTQRTANFIQDLPYTEELRPAYDHIIGMYVYSLKNVQGAERWLAIFKNKAEEKEDLRAIGEVFNHTAMLLSRQGNLKSAIIYYKKAVNHFTHIGDDKHACRALRGLGVSYFKSGDLDEAENNISLSLEKARVIDNTIDLSLGYWFKAQIQLCQGLRKESTETFNIAQDLALKSPVARGSWIFLGLGQVHFSHANAEEITDYNKYSLENIPELTFRNPYLTARILSKLERSYLDPSDFRTFVDQFHQIHSNLNQAPFSQWYLVPIEVFDHIGQPTCKGDFITKIPQCLTWIDPLGDCTYDLKDGLIIRSVNERNFYNINTSAPRFVNKTPIIYDFIVQTLCTFVSEGEPAIGGLLLWQNEKNWLCLELGGLGPDEILFRGFKDNDDFIFGRGLLRSKTAYLRIAKQGAQISALCSPDNEKWFLVGNTHLPSPDPIYPGIHAIGHINRMIYPGAYSHGTEIKFTEFCLWKK